MLQFTTEANVHKRLQRARETLRESTTDLISPPLDTLQPRLPSVHEILYLLFNEGYLAIHAESAIRRELCDEAIRADVSAALIVGPEPSCR